MLAARMVTRIFLLWFTIFGPTAVSAQNYPTKPIRIVTGGAGSGNDFLARLIAPYVSESLGQPIIIDNRPGGMIAPELASKAPPDGYTLLANGTTFMLAHLLQETPFDPLRDFAPISRIEKSPNILVVHPGLPVKSVKDLMALAKAKPGVLNFASSAIGNTGHLGGELFNSMAGVNTVLILYNSNAPAVVGLIAGEVNFFFVNTPTVAPHVQSGKLRALAGTGLQPSPLLPGLPTVADTLPGYQLISLAGIFAPAKTPQAIITRLNREIIRVANRADIKERFFNAGVEVVTSTPEELTATVKSEIALWGKVIKDRGIRAK